MFGLDSVQRSDDFRPSALKARAGCKRQQAGLSWISIDRRTASRDVQETLEPPIFLEVGWRCSGTDGLAPELGYRVLAAGEWVASCVLGEPDPVRQG